MSPASIVKLVVSGIAGLFVLVVVFSGFTTIESGYEGVLLKFGSVSDTPLHPGLHLKIPFYENINEVSIQPQTFDSRESAATHDLQDVATEVAVIYHVDPENVPYFYQTFRSFNAIQTNIIRPVTSNDVKAVTAHYNAEELITKRDLVDSQIKDAIKRDLLPYRISIEAINTNNFMFSRGYSEAIEQKQIQEQNTLRAKGALEQTRVDAQRNVVTAEATAEANIAEAKGKAEATILRAEADAKANGLLSASITPQIIQRATIDKWDGNLPTYMSSGAPLPFIGSVATQK